MKNTEKKEKIEKGYYGYLSSYKKRQGIIGFLSLAMVFVIYFTGIIIYHSNKTIFTVMAAVSVLPAAKYLIMFFVVFPFKTGSRDIYEKLIPYCKNRGWLSVDEDTVNEVIKDSCLEEKATMLSDMVLTYDKYIMNIGFIIINRGHVFAFTDHKKTDKKYTDEYIKKILDNSCNYKSYKFYTDSSLFIRDVIKDTEVNNDNSPKILANDLLIARKLLPYSI